MKKQTFQNEEIRKLGDKVLQAIKLSETEVDRIANSSGLFERIRQAADDERRLIEKRDVTEVRAGGYGFLWQAAGCCAFLVVFAAGDFVLTYFKSSTVQPDVSVINDQPITSDKEIPGAPNSLENSKPFTLSAERAEIISPVRSVEVARKRRISPTTGKSQLKIKLVIPKTQEEMGDFQSLGLDGEMTAETGRVIRVELPRASLFAMGVNIPVENGNALVKTDLLISSDGIMKAVRVAKFN